MFVSFNQEINLIINDPSSGSTNEPNDGGVPLESGAQLGTGGISCVKKIVVCIIIKNI